MGFLRRILGRDGSRRGAGGGDADGGSPATAPGDVATIEAEERARELELARFDRDRLDDLVRRQERYADRKWTPPDQGGTRRADDEDAAAT
ncbi:MAG: hypothetical protein ABIZ72_02190 [Candidatus Limnocylindrales bacterium]